MSLCCEYCDDHGMCEDEECTCHTGYVTIVDPREFHTGQSMQQVRFT